MASDITKHVENTPLMIQILPKIENTLSQDHPQNSVMYSTGTMEHLHYNGFNEILEMELILWCMHICKKNTS